MSQDVMLISVFPESTAGLPKLAPTTPCHVNGMQGAGHFLQVTKHGVHDPPLNPTPHLHLLFLAVQQLWLLKQCENRKVKFIRTPRSEG